MAGSEREGRNITIRFNEKEADIVEWLQKQPNRSAYLKKLILAEKAKASSGAPVKLLNNYDTLWENRFKMVCSFFEIYGRLPRYNEVFQGVKLGRWLEVHIKRDRNRPERMERYAQIGALDKWYCFYKSLKEFVALRGRLPQKDECFRDIAIGAWLFRQRNLMRNNDTSLSATQKDMLLQLGVMGSDWETKYALVKAFIDENGFVPKYKDTYNGVKVGRWLYAQRKVLNSQKDAIKIQKLKIIGAYERICKKQKRKFKKDD